MNIYVAGRVTHLAEVREVQGFLQDAGHVITHDWTTVVEERLQGTVPFSVLPGTVKETMGRNDLRGVKDSDVLVAVAGPAWLGTAIEIGAALAWRKPVVLFGAPHRDTVFFYLPEVLHCSMTREDLLGAVEEAFNRHHRRSGHVSYGL